MKRLQILPILLLTIAVLPTGCNMQRKQQNTYERPMPEGYYGNYQVWGGPGRYYGVYFYNERSYRKWTNRHYNRTHHDRWSHRSHRDQWGTRGHHHGGRRHR